MSSDPMRAAVLGATGYAGGELVRLLAHHPSVEVTFVGARGSAGRTLAEVDPHLGRLPIASATLGGVEAEAVGSAAGVAEVAFCALPHGASAVPAPALLEAGVRVIDLAGDFRLLAGAYPGWYGFDHPSPEWLAKAVYGLPELFGDQIRGAQLVANPGCFPTPVMLGLAPLLASGLVEPGVIHVDGKTGLSGAGRGAGDAGLYVTMEGSVRPYRAPVHQHTPEMERGLELATGLSPSILFVPHLVPAVRGVVTTSYARLAPGVTGDQLTEALVTAHADHPFITVLPSGQMVDPKRTQGTNVLELQAIADPRTGSAVVIGALDNLVKGAAGQAIQNLNLAAGFDEGAGLPIVAAYP